MPLPLALLAASPLIAKLGTALVGLGSAAATGYSIYRNQKDIDYQKALQNDIFNREDNAVQRRMNDLQAAGLNPNLAAGSAAGSGAIVGRSSTPGITGNPLGDALDYAQHVAQLEGQKLENKILDNQETISGFNAALAKYEYGTSKMQQLFDRATMYQQLGVDDLQLRFDKTGNMTLWSPSFNLDNDGTYHLDLQDSPLMQQLRWQVQNNKNSADLLQRDVDFYVADKIGQYLGQGVQLFSGAGSGYFNFTRRR